MAKKKKEKLLTREDVLKAIEENGGTAKGLDLSNCKFVESVDLSGLDLQGIILDGAEFPPKPEFADPEDPRLVTKLTGANLQEVDLSSASLNSAYLWRAQLQKAKFYYSQVQEAFLVQTKLQQANLSFAKLQGANLEDATFDDTDLHGVEFNSATKFDLAHWGNYVLGEEKNGLFTWAEDTYRRLKMWHTNAGMHDIAAKFYYREKEANRKSLKLCSKDWNNRLAAEFMRALFGYGEEWKRIFIWMAVVIFGFAAAYHFWGSFTSSSFWDTLYYSVASFTALGYGQWAPQPTGWAKGVGAAEAIIGVSMMALLLVTFFRKWTR